MQCLRRLQRVLQPVGSLACSPGVDRGGVLHSAGSSAGTSGLAPPAALAAVLERMGLAERLSQRSVHSSTCSTSSSSSASSSRGTHSTSSNASPAANMYHSSGHRHTAAPSMRQCAPAPLQHLLSTPLQTASLLNSTRSYASRHTRGVRSRRRRLNNRASWAAVRPFLDQQAAGKAGVRTPKGLRPPAIASAIPPLPKLPEPTHVQRIGSITQQYALAHQQAFAVVQLGPFQYKVTANDLVFHPRLYTQGSAGQGSAGAKPRPQDLAWRPVAVNEVLKLGKVLMWGDAQRTVVGRPYVPGAHVIAVVEEQFKDAKVQVYKKQKRKRQSKRHGHRSFLTTLRVLEVQLGEQALGALEAAEAPDAPQQQPQQHEAGHGAIEATAAPVGVQEVAELAAAGSEHVLHEQQQQQRRQQQQQQQQQHTQQQQHHKQQQHGHACA